VEIRAVVTDLGAAKLTGPPEALQWVGDLCSFQTRSWEPVSRRWVIDRHDLLIRVMGGAELPPGLVSIVAAAAPAAGHSVVVEDLRTPPQDNLPLDLTAPPWTLRADQIDAISAVLQGPKVLPGRGILDAPTGWGKSRVACALAASVGGRWLFLIHRKHLAADVAQRWADLTGRRAGWVGDGQWEIPDDRDTLVCASLQTLARRLEQGCEQTLELLRSAVGVIEDECHTAAAASNLAVLRAISAYYRIGLSGTPLDRSDRRSALVLAWLGPVVHRIDPRTVIAAGALAQPTVRVVPVDESLPERGEDQPPYAWREVYGALIERSPKRNAAVVAVMGIATAPGMVFVRHVAHGLALARAAAKSGLSVDFIDGSASLRQREEALARLARGDVQWIITTKVFTEGVNVPSLETVVYAAGGKSVIDVLQSIGRAMRVTATKQTCTVWDFGDRGHPTLYAHAKARLRACKRQGYPIVVDRSIAF
jgi:superfamily II DNA or RNA helicase